MKKLFLLLLIGVASCSSERKLVTVTGKFTDERDVHTYKWIKIGKQVWMAENLNYKTKGSSYYDNDVTNGEIYGSLYNFDALKAACPKGWHVPSDAEWQQLEAEIGMDINDTKKYRFRSNVAQELLPGAASGFDLKFAGAFGLGKFTRLNEWTYFWTSTQDGNPIITRLIMNGDDRICKNLNGIGWKLSLRCIKDE
jgi:uncharacterized protein (TIGR02145 family)